MRKTLLLVVCLSVLILAANAQDFKNLAGSAEEMDAMRLPSAESLGTRSKSAMLPVKFQNGKFSVDVPIETTDDLKISVAGAEFEIVADQSRHRRRRDQSARRESVDRTARRRSRSRRREISGGDFQFRICERRNVAHRDRRAENERLYATAKPPDLSSFRQIAVSDLHLR